MKLLLLILYFIILINNNVIINAIKPSTDQEYLALKDILSSIISKKDYDLIYTSDPVDFCTIQNFTTTYCMLSILCKTVDTNQYFDYMKIVTTSSFSYSLGYDSFNQFVQLSNLDLIFQVNELPPSRDSFGDDESQDKNKGVAKSLFLNIKLDDLAVIPLPTTSLTLDSLIQQPPVINFKILKNILDYKYINLKIAPPFYNNNMISTTSIKNMNTFYFSTLNVPSFESISVKDLQMKLLDGFDQNSIGNLTTLGLSDSVSIEFNGAIDFPTFQLEKTTQLYIKGKFNVPSSKVDFKACLNLKKLSVSSNLTTFNYNGEIPFKDFTSSLTYLSLPNIGLTISPDISSTNIQDLILNNNQLTQVPESFCQLNIQTLDLSNNVDLETPLPDCFRCYKRTLANYYKTAFAGAPNIINWVNSETIDIDSCGKIQPKLKYNSNTKEIQLSGKNLGFSNPVGKYKNPQDIEETIQFSVIKYSSLFTAQWVNSYNIPDIFTITFDGDDYLVGTLGQAPLVEKVLKLDSNIFLFEGLYFGYLIDSVSITFSPYNDISNSEDDNSEENEIECEITSVSFNSIQCDIDSSKLNPNVTLYIVVISVDELSTQITINPTLETEQTITQCEKKCQNGGICISESGKCECDDKYLGDDCSIVKCPNDCSGLDHGICNELTGICECALYKYTGIDCSTPNHTATRFSTPTITGGPITIEGWFGDIHSNLSIKIGDDSCSINEVNSTFINCTIGPQLAGYYDVNITQNNIEWFEKDRLEFLDTEKYKEKSSWILPVAIIIPCVVIVGANIVGIIYVYKRQRINLFFEKRKKTVVSLEEFN